MSAPPRPTEAPPSREPIHPRPPTPDSAPRWQAGNLALRLLTAALLIPPLIYVILEGGLWVLGTVVVATLLGVNEFYQLIEAKGAEPLRGVGMLAAVALPIVTYLGSDYAATVLMSFLLLGVMVAQLGKAQIADSLASISGTFFGVFYVGWLLSHAVGLREFHDVVVGRFGPEAAANLDPEAGAFYLLFTLSVVIAGDVGAYFVGRKYGRRKLAPAVSPGKTVEGAFGALGAGLLVGLIAKAVFDAFRPELSSQLGWLASGFFGLLLAGVGIIGDLVESLLKRDAKVKDTGTLLPGMGGILDRIDSILLGIPVMYYLLLAHTFLFGRVPLAVVGVGSL